MTVAPDVDPDGTRDQGDAAELSIAADTTQALVLIGHGSTISPDADAPVYRHAGSIRSLGVFDEVREAFWREQPSIRGALRSLESDEAYVVPLFMSEGYFAGDVVPRELENSEQCYDGDLRYADPVGSHRMMTDVVLHHAEKIRGSSGEETALALVGHGTQRNPQSKRSVRTHTTKIRGRGVYDEVKAFFLDDEPRVWRLTEFFDAPEIVVVPVFMADGHHTLEDVPREIGLKDRPDSAENGFVSEGVVDGHRLRYAGAVGTDERIADIALRRAREEGAVLPDPVVMEIGEAGTESVHRGSVSELAEHEEAFMEWVEKEGRVEFGELVVEAKPSVSGDRDSENHPDAYEVHHVQDSASVSGGSVEIYTDPSELRRHTRFTDEGDYRPLKTATTLRSGWKFVGVQPGEVVRVVETIYPGAVINWYLDRDEESEAWVKHFDELLDNRGSPDIGLERLKDVCCDEGCVMSRRWGFDGGVSDDVRSNGSDTLVTAEPPCLEPCPFVRSVVREASREDSMDGLDLLDYCREEYGLRIFERREEKL